VAGAVVGLYSGLAAGIFANLIGLVSGLCLGLSRVIDVFRPASATRGLLARQLALTDWHTEYAIVGIPLAAGALLLARGMRPGGPRDLVKQRLRVLALLVLAALSLYYPLVALTALNVVLGRSRDVAQALSAFPWWAMLLAPMVGGAVVGRLLKNRPETHGHGIPEVVLAVKREGPLAAPGGMMKLIASAVTIGSGGSAGREGPVVYAGAAFASGVGKTLGFSRRELSILLACGAGGGIAASFDAPIAGAVFAMEIILRAFELSSLSPIVLASVTATMVGRGTMGDVRLLQHVSYQVVSGWEIVAYVVLGLLCGLISYAFVQLLHAVEDFCAGRYPGKWSAALAKRSLPARAALGGLCAGLMALASPAVWGLGQQFIDSAAIGQLAFGFLVVACVLKLVATAVTLGSGGSGGTFTPATVMGAMAGGAFGTALHALFPHHTAGSGAYAIVGMGGMIAGLTRGPLTGMMMIYELSGSPTIILSLMVTCAIASALCHQLIERKAPKQRSEEDVLRETEVRRVSADVTPVASDLTLRPLADLLIASQDGALPVLDGQGRIYGIVEVDALRDVWREEQMYPLIVAKDLARPVPTLSAEQDLSTALEMMDQQDVDAVPVVDKQRSATPYGILTRTAIRRFVLREQQSNKDLRAPVASTEIPA
jgi:CIC family chloride channel protein